MTSSRHRFFPTGTEVCGGYLANAVCSLPKGNPWHYNDQDHPFEPKLMRPAECRWVLDQADGDLCSADVEDPVHIDGALPADNEPVTVVMQVPVEEPPVVRGAMQGLPEDYSVGVLAAEAESYRWSADPETVAALKTSAPLPPGFVPAAEGSGGGGRPDVAHAVAQLTDMEVSLPYGPWPVRKFMLADTEDAHDERMEMGLYAEALDTLGQDYSVWVFRPAGRPWRFALVTWDWCLGLTLETAADELVAFYG